MKIDNESAHPLSAKEPKEYSARPKRISWLSIAGTALGVFSLCLVFCRSVNSASFAENPGRAVKQASIATLVLVAVAALGRSFNRPWE